MTLKKGKPEANYFKRLDTLFSTQESVYIQKLKQCYRLKYNFCLEQNLQNQRHGELHRES